jgi:hypothetical protein
MASLRVNCPACGRLLEIDAEYAGKEVECGDCLQVFVAEAPSTPKIKVQTGLPPGIKGKPRRRRDDEEEDEVDRRGEYDDDDYEPPHRAGIGGVAAGGTAAVGLIVGIVALVTACCPLTGIGFGVVVMVLGSIGKGHPSAAGTGRAASILGSIAFTISVGMIVLWFALGGRKFLGN